jgi:hypothetical protein
VVLAHALERDEAGKEIGRDSLHLARNRHVEAIHD